MRTVIYGGLKDFVEEKITPVIEEYGLVVQAHHDMRGLTNRAPAPPAWADVVVILYEMVGHNTEYAIKGTDAKVIRASRKEPFLRQALERAGFQRVKTDDHNSGETPHEEKPMAQQHSTTTTKPWEVEVYENDWPQLQEKLKALLTAMRLHGLEELTLRDGKLKFNRVVREEIEESLS